MKNKLIIAVAILVGIGLGAGGIQLLNTKSSAAACSGPQPGVQNHSVMIMDSKAEPATTSAKLCDTLTITNMDDIEREVAFGPHEDHIPYDGVTVKLLKKDQSFTVTLNQTGSFHFHDHVHDDADGYFTVSK